MRIASKLQVAVTKPVVVPFAIKRDRKLGLVISSGPIDWKLLSEDQIRAQWIRCTSIIWEAEKDGVIGREHLEPFLYILLEKIGWSKPDIDAIKSHKLSLIPFSVLSSAFMFMHGGRNPESKQYFLKVMNDLREQGSRNLAAAQQDLTKEAKPKPDVQKAMKEHLSVVLGELQGLEDDRAKNVFDWLRANNVPKVHVSAIENYFKPRLKEVLMAQGKTDDQLIEAYAPYKKKEMRELVDWYENLMKDLYAYKRLKNSQRKVRARKSKTPVQLVRKLKYLGYDPEHNLTSIKPETIIGADTLWLYDTKKRRLIAYVASELDKELTVKGSYILGWDPKKSMGKTLRRSKDQLKEFLSGGKVAMRRFVDDIRGKEAKLNGKINKYTVLVKTYS